MRGLFAAMLMIVCMVTSPRVRAMESVDQMPGTARVNLDSSAVPARKFLKEIWYDERDAFNGISILDDGNWIEMNGSMYRVVSTSRSDEEVLYLCIEDAPAPFMFLNSPWSPESESSQAHPVSRVRILPDVSPDIQTEFTLQSPALERVFPLFEFQLLSFEPEVVPPPPKSI